MFFCSTLLGSEGGKMEKAEMADLWVDYVVAVHEDN